jgi:hypothetical protein
VARTLFEDAYDGMCRHGFQHVLDVVAQMVRILKAGGKDAVVDMDNLLKREALDVIGECPPRCSMIIPTMSTLTSYTVFSAADLPVCGKCALFDMS